MGELKELEEITNLNPEHLRFCLQNLGRYMPYDGTGLPAEEAIPLVIDHISSVHGYEHDNLPNIPVRLILRLFSILLFLDQKNEKTK